MKPDRTRDTGLVVDGAPAASMAVQPDPEKPAENPPKPIDKTTGHVVSDEVSLVIEQKLTQFERHIQGAIDSSREIREWLERRRRKSRKAS